MLTWTGDDMPRQKLWIVLQFDSQLIALCSKSADCTFELAKRKSAVRIFVMVDYTFVYSLLQLYISKIFSDHHFKNPEAVGIGYKSIAVLIIDIKNTSEFLVRIRFATEECHSLGKFTEVNHTVVVAVEYFHNSGS